MITIIHGDDIVSSRNKLTNLKGEFSNHEIIQLIGEYVTLTDIAQVFESQSLFGQKKLLILEKMLETKDKKLVAAILNNFRKYPNQDVIFWEPKEIKKEFLSLFPKTSQAFLYKQERQLFRFLDSIAPHNTQEMLKLLSEVRKQEADELMLHMLIRQFRILLAIATRADITEVKRMAPWQRVKLDRQARMFTNSQLTSIYTRLFRIEKETKTGTSSLPLSSSLDLFLTEL